MIGPTGLPGQRDPIDPGHQARPTKPLSSLQAPSSVVCSGARELPPGRIRVARAIKKRTKRCQTLLHQLVASRPEVRQVNRLAAMINGGRPIFGPPIKLGQFWSPSLPAGDLAAPDPDHESCARRRPPIVWPSHSKRPKVGRLCGRSLKFYCLAVKFASRASRSIVKQQSAR